MCVYSQGMPDMGTVPFKDLVQHKPDSSCYEQSPHESAQLCSSGSNRVLQTSDWNTVHKRQPARTPRQVAPLDLLLFILLFFSIFLWFILDFVCFYDWCFNEALHVENNAKNHLIIHMHVHVLDLCTPRTCTLNLHVYNVGCTISTVLWI